jgi:hypothetical protein
MYWEYIVTVTNLHGETINTCRVDLPGVGTWDFDDGGWFTHYFIYFANRFWQLNQSLKLRG